MRDHVIDASLVNDEVFLAEFRVAYLLDFVDFFYFFDATHTHSGSPKDSRFEERFDSHGVQNIFHVTIPVPEKVLAKNDRWAIEEYSRDWATHYLSRKHPESLIVLSDIDEIPSRNQLERLPQSLRSRGVVSVPMATSYLFANWVADRGRSSWRRARAFVGRNGAPGLRFHAVPATEGEPGSHFRYLGMNQAAIGRKHKAFAHEELDSAVFRDAPVDEYCREFGLVLLGHADRRGGGLLTCQSRDMLSGPQLHMLREYPHLFRFDPAWPPRRTRHVASYLLTKAVRRSFPLLLALRPHEFRGYDVAGALAFALWATSGLAMLTRVAVRLFSIDKSDNPNRTLLHKARGVYRYGMSGLDFFSAELEKNRGPSASA